MVLFPVFQESGPYFSVLLEFKPVANTVCIRHMASCPEPYFCVISQVMRRDPCHSMVRIRENPVMSNTE